MEAAIQALSETLTGFLGVDATGAIDGDDDDEPALVTRLNEVAGAAAEAFAASTATPQALRSPAALGMWEFGNAAAQCRAADAALTEALVAGLSKSEEGAGGMPGVAGRIDDARGRLDAAFMAQHDTFKALTAADLEVTDIQAPGLRQVISPADIVGGSARNDET